MSKIIRICNDESGKTLRKFGIIFREELGSIEVCKLLKSYLKLSKTNISNNNEMKHVIIELTDMWKGSFKFFDEKPKEASAVVEYNPFTGNVKITWNEGYENHNIGPFKFSKNSDNFKKSSEDKIIKPKKIKLYKNISAVNTFKKYGIEPELMTVSEFKPAYRKLINKLHPDTGGDINKAKEVNNAWNSLKKRIGGIINRIYFTIKRNINE